MGWADVTKYYLTNPISGAWAGAYLVNTKSWEKLPKHLQEIYKLSMYYSHYYRLHWYWWGEAHYRVNGGKLKLTTIPESEWKQVRAEALKFWDEIAKKSGRNGQGVKILWPCLKLWRACFGPAVQVGDLHPVGSARLDCV